MPYSMINFNLLLALNVITLRGDISRSSPVLGFLPPCGLFPTWKVPKPETFTDSPSLKRLFERIKYYFNYVLSLF